MSEKTEEPTPRRLERARREGDAPVSSALMSAVGLVIAASLAPGAIKAVAIRAEGMLREVLAQPDVMPSAVDALRAGVELSTPLLLAVAGAAAVVGFVQTGALIAPARISPKLDRLSPAALVQSLLSPQRAFSVLRAMITAVAVGWLLLRRLGDALPDLAHASGRIDKTGLLASSEMIVDRYGQSAPGPIRVDLDSMLRRYSKI